MNRDIVWTTQFKKDYKLALKRHMDIELLIISLEVYLVVKLCPRKIKTMR